MQYLLVANYGDGTASVLPIDKATGALLPATDTVHDVGSGPVPGRQDGPHCHEVISVPVGNCDPPDPRCDAFVFVPDLGIDKVMQWRLDGPTGQLTPNAASPFFSTQPGVGPRHMAFSPSADVAYVLGELDASITIVSYNRTAGVLDKQLDKISTLPPGVERTGVFPAELIISPDGRFLYCSNRGDEGVLHHNSIAVFSIARGSASVHKVSLPLL